MDIFAGVSVCIVLIPACVAYADLAGLPPQSGLYTALAGMMCYALFGHSRQLIVGPDAALSLLVAAAIGPLAGGNLAQYIQLSSILALLVGVLMLIAAKAKLGAIADLLSKPVLLGFMNGAALILIASQLGKWTGIQLHESAFFPRLVELINHLTDIHSTTLIIGTLSVLLLALLRFLTPKLPAAILLFIIAIFTAYGLELGKHGVILLGELPAGLPHLAAPHLLLSEITLLLPAAAGIALLAMPEGILLARAFAQKNGYEIDPNRELMALGLANITASLAQGFALGASQSRTAINDAAGSKSTLSGLVAALLLLIFLLFLSDSLRHLPVTTLSALLIFAGVNLIEVRAWVEMFRIDKTAAFFSLITTMGVLAVGILPGIIVGILLSLAYLIQFMARPFDAVLCEAEGRKGFHDVGEAEISGSSRYLQGLLVYRFYAPLLFANSSYFFDRICQLVANDGDTRWVLIDAQAITFLDVTAAEQLLRLNTMLEEAGIDLKFARCNRPLREALDRYGITPAIGADSFFSHVHDALHEYKHLYPDVVTEPVGTTEWNGIDRRRN
ncbi:SulP family inorganic anion transporter [Chitinibacter bivalviorum]|uniref:SulP family inorganic anion transporter n=1 Tax=Chitinibacter bivalviorum TaxID=2739434 RepID=A0A7H9BMC6_9NEIS|nr:SulP family inorganic anion transporter [Chitinibacter bivalviorum]QLG89715.1 SulP family inorganic anion transporter [Chitinibacter bivalviorum]